VGEVLGDFEVYDCEGNPLRIHTLCETEVVWIWELAEWCSPCRRFAEGPYDDIYTRYATTYGDRFAGLAIITADAELNLPDPLICQELRERYGIDAPLYFDPTGRFRDVLGGLSNDVHAIMTRGLRVAWTMQFGGEFVNRRLQETFDALDRGTEFPDADVSFDAGPLEDAFLAADAGP
jgi:thiol-disulfide isomerase/thioredoxin